MNRFDEPIDWFATRMSQKMNQNDWKPGWHQDSLLALLLRLKEETAELEQLVIEASPTSPVNIEQIINESADIANFAMMIADNARRGGLPELLDDEEMASK